MKPEGLQIPPRAVTFSVYQVWTATVNDGETGKPRKQFRTKRLHGAADPETGELAATWPVKEFSIKAIRQQWGTGRYRIDWLDAHKKLCGRYGPLEVIDPAQQPHTKLRTLPVDGAQAAAAPTPVQAAPQQATAAGPMGFMDLILLLNSMRDKEAEIAREAAAATAERDRNFLASIMTGQQTNQAAIITALTTITRPSESKPVDGDLLRRELKLSVQEEMLGIKTMLAERGGDDDDYEAPKNLKQARDRVLMGLLEQLEDQVPEAVGDIIPAIAAWAKRKGVKLTERLQNDVARVGTKQKTQRQQQPAQLSQAQRIREAQQALDAARGNGAEEEEEEEEEEPEERADA